MQVLNRTTLIINNYLSKIFLSVFFFIFISPLVSHAGFFSGKYEGTVEIFVPNNLGVMDLSLKITDNNGSLSGSINKDRVLIVKYRDPSNPNIGDFKEPVFTGNGQITGAEKIFNITFAPFTNEVSGKTVTRNITLTGEQLTLPDPNDSTKTIILPAIEDYGSVVRGKYKETITGFLPEPIIIEGRFTIMREEALEFGIDLNADGKTSLDELRVAGIHEDKIEASEMYIGLKNYMDTVMHQPGGKTLDLKTITDAIQEYNDTDDDGVDNYKDLCPDTPPAQTVDADGCSQSQKEGR